MGKLYRRETLAISRGWNQTELARWVLALLPLPTGYRRGPSRQPPLRPPGSLPASIPRYDVLTAAAYIGLTRPVEVRMGQVSIFWPTEAVEIRRQQQPQRFRRLMLAAGSRWKLSTIASILRTAIMLGLRLPRVELGVMSPTRREVFSREELYGMLLEGREAGADMPAWEP